MPEHSASNASRQAQALARAERIVEAARDLLADPDNNMEIRRRYMQRVFNLDRAAEAWVALADRSSQEGAGEPVALILHCPACGVQHIDTPDEATGWTNPPHRSHLCLACGHIWRPADVPTNGVAALQTKGAADSTSPPDPQALTNALEMTGLKTEAELIDMANVGQSLQERIADLAKQDGPFKGWMPADDPAEIVWDLVNHYEDQAQALLGKVKALQGALEEALKALRPLARLEVPKKPDGNAGFYSIRHTDIRRAQAVVAEAQP